MTTESTNEVTAGLYHTDRNGNPAKCEATKEPCPLREGGHYATPNDARAAYEERNDPFEDIAPRDIAANEIEFSVPFTAKITKFDHCGIATAKREDGTEITMVMEYDPDDDGKMWQSDLSDLGGALWEASGNSTNDWNNMLEKEKMAWMSDKVVTKNDVTFHNVRGKIGWESEYGGVGAKGKRTEDFRIASFGA